MNLLEFLQAVTPDDGKLIAAEMCEGKKNGKTFYYFKHVVADTHEDLRGQIARLAKLKVNTYFALASYTQGFHENTKGKVVIRTRDNVHKLKALWFDIDFKSGLSNPTEVVAAIREFCNRTGMPAPSILVHSGNGIHAYWPFINAISVSRWLPLAEALKKAASDCQLQADLVCTADPARVLRPIGTANWKDPANPKPVVPAFSSGKLFGVDDLEKCLLGSSTEGGLGAVPAFLGGVVDGGNTESLSAGVGSPRQIESFIVNIAKKCGVISHHFETGGEDASEPEWKDVLQLTKHCADGELHYHALSSGHPGYDKADTEHKWQQRLENDAGPTLCDTFAGYRPDICGACPHRKEVKTPLSLGEEIVAGHDGKEYPLKTWRPVEGDLGMERKMFDPASRSYYWEKVLNRTWEVDCAASDMLSKEYTLTITSRLGNARPITIDISGRLLGDTHALKKELGINGVPIKQTEVTHWITLMTTWLEDIQKKRQVGKSVSRLGWIEERDSENNIKVKGFTAGNTSFPVAGDPVSNMRIATDYREIARHYIPQGDIEYWYECARFLAEQNNPAFTCTVASAFAAPLFGFTGMPGAMLTLCSKQSGVGKSSALKTAQAVWGHPTSGLNSTSDTYLSIIRKTAFLKNLPVYWDEIRGEHALEAFYKTAFDIAQGKERTRLNTNAELREINDWKTIVVGASNESIFDYMGYAGGQSDAATARTFELTVQPFDDPRRAERNAMFGLLDSNFGHAGQLYASYLARNHNAVRQTVRSAYESIYREWGFHEGERFWAAMCASLLVGAGIASRAGLVTLDTKAMKQFLQDTVTVLRVKTERSLIGASAREIMVAYLQAHQDNQMQLDSFGRPGKNVATPVIQKPPTRKLMIVKVGDTYRFLSTDFRKWLKAAHGYTFNSLEGEMKNDLGLRTMHTVLGAGTNYSLPKAVVLEVTM